MPASAEDLPLFTGEIEIDPHPRSTLAPFEPSKEDSADSMEKEALRRGLDWQQVLAPEFADNLFALRQARHFA